MLGYKAQGRIQGGIPGARPRKIGKNMKALNSIIIIIIIFNNFRKTEHNHQQGLRRGKYQGGHRSSIFPHFVFTFNSQPVK
jgi:hypothetical protein